MEIAQGLKHLTQQSKKGENERLRGKKDKVNFIDFRFEGKRVVVFGKGRRGLVVTQIARSWDEG